MLKIYFDNEKETEVGNQIKSIVSKGISNDEVKELIDSVMNEVFYAILLGLDGETSLRDVQMQYKVYGENDVISAGFDFFFEDLQAGEFDKDHFTIISITKL